MKGKNRAKTALDWAVNEMPVQKNGELTCCETDYFSGVVACTSTFQGSVAVEGFFGRAHGGLYLFVALAKTLLLPFPKKNYLHVSGILPADICSSPILAFPKTRLSYENSVAFLSAFPALLPV
jgi:hypothetical protein